MAFGGVNSASGTSVTLTGVTAGATIVVWAPSTNGNATAFAASDAQGSYATRGTIFTLGSGNSNCQALVLTNANSGSHTITASATGDTPFLIVAAWWTGVGDVDNSLAAHAEQGVTVAGSAPNNITSGTCTTTTANTTVIGFCNFESASTPGIGTSPNAFTSRLATTVGGLGVAVEDFAFSGTGSIAATFGGTAGTLALVQVLALAPAAGGSTPFVDNPTSSTQEYRTAKSIAAITAFGLAATLMPVQPLQRPEQLQTPTVLQYHMPGRGILNANTSQGMPRTIRGPDATQQVRDYPFWTIDSKARVRDVRDTSKGTNPNLLPPGVATRPFIVAPSITIPRPLALNFNTARGWNPNLLIPIGKAWTTSAPQKYWYQADTSSDTNPGLLSPSSGALPVGQTVLHQAPARFWWQPADTSQSSAKATYADSTVPNFNPPQFLADRIRPVTDTSQIPNVGLLPIPPTPLPAGQQTPQSAPQKYWYLSDTSAGTPAALQVVLPVVQNVLFPTLDPVRTVWNTSQGMPKTLYGDSTVPMQNVPQYQVDSIRPVFNTSQSSWVAYAPAFVVRNIIIIINE